MIVLQNKKSGRLVGASFDTSKRILQLDQKPFYMCVKRAQRDYFLLDACAWERIELRARGFVIEEIRR